MPHRTVLIVDDEAPLRRALRVRFEAAGYEVTEAADGAGALDEAIRSCPDAIVLDVRMRDMYGFEVCHHLRARPQFRDTPIVFLSAADGENATELAEDAGGTAYFTKPFDPAAVIAAIDGLLPAVG